MDKEKKDPIQVQLEKLYPELKGIHMEKFIHIIKKTGLDPLRNQIYVVERSKKTPKGWEKTFTPQTSIDGFRLIAERTGKYAPGKEPKWNYNERGALESATAYVKKMTQDGTWHEVGATAYFDEYAQKMKDGSYTPFWRKMGRLMIAKCAEALALRKAFPDALSEVYTDDEMDQATTNGNDEEKKKEIKEAKKIIGLKEIQDIYNLLLSLPDGEEEKMLNWAQVEKVEDLTLEKYLTVKKFLIQKINLKEKSND